MSEVLEDSFLAAVLFEQSKPLKLERLILQAPGKGQILVRMISAGLCGAQINEIDGVKGPDGFLPHLMGHEGFGRVVLVGEGVHKMAVGDHVVLHWRKGLGCDCGGARYPYISGTIGSGPVTTFSEMSIVSENRATSIDFRESLTEIYPLVGCAISTAYGLLKYEAPVEKGAKVLITGAGGLGLASAFWLSLLDTEDVLLVDRLERKRTLVENFGARYHSLESKPDALEIKDEFDLCIETTGNVDVISRCFDALRRKGRLVLVGQPRFDQRLVLNNPLKIFDGIRIFSSDGGGIHPQNDFPEILRLVSENADLAKKLITHRIPLSQINEGFQIMKSGEAGRVIVNFNQA